MIITVLNKYDPNDRKTHSILRFFAEDLNEENKIKFIELIFDKGSWLLPTEIYKSSESNNLKGYTEHKFFQIFNKWVDDRIKHNSILSSHNRNPNVPKQYIFEYIEILFSIRNLGFPDKLLSTLERLFKSCISSYLDVLYESSFNLVIENFDEKEIEKFFDFFLKDYLIEKSININRFLYGFLNTLAYSHKIFHLSPIFVEKLNVLSESLKEEDYKKDFLLVISILHIELIIHKQLDLKEAKFSNLIEQSISGLDRGNLNNLIFFRFLKRFNYPFDNYEAEKEINALLELLQTNFNKGNYVGEIKNKIVHHFIKHSNQYFELLLFNLSLTSDEFSKKALVEFIKLVDEIRTSFSSSVLWFNEFLNFKIIPGKIFTINFPGFEVKIDNKFYENKIEELGLLTNFYSEPLVSKFGCGFMHRNNLRTYPEVIKLLSNKKKEYILGNISEINSPNLFLIINLNYSSSNSGNIIRFIPNPISNKVLANIYKYKLKAVFSSLELFLINQGANFLNNQSLIQIQISELIPLFPFNNFDDYNLNFSRESFWDILKDLRPHLYEQIYLNPKKAEMAFPELVKAYENQTILKGIIKSRTKGGMFVEVNYSIAFLPGSQIDVKPVVDYDSYVGRTMDFKVVNVFPELNNVVVSHRAVIEPIIEEQRKEKINKLEKGQTVKGVVKNITSYGVFMDLGYVDGLIHVTDLSWSRVNDVSEIVEIGQSLNVIILDFDENKSRIQLGLKQLCPNPWEPFGKQMKIGDIVRGSVVEVTDYGVFVEIAEGIEGLIHKKEMSWRFLSVENKSDSKYINKLFQLGDKVEAIILSLDTENRKISLSTKQLLPDPWTDINKKYPVNSEHSGLVVNITNFGAFVALEDGIDGLLHISGLSWKKKLNHPSEFCAVGDKLEVVILKVNEKERKINLGLKQITEILYEKYKIKYPLGTIHVGKILDITNKGATIQLNKEIVAFVPSHYIKRDKANIFKKGEEAEFKINKFSKYSEHIEVTPISVHKKESNLLKENSQQNQSGYIKIGSKIVLEPKGQSIEWFCIGNNLSGFKKINTNSDFALKLINKNVGDIIDQGNGYKVLFIY